VPGGSRRRLGTAVSASARRAVARTIALALLIISIPLTLGAPQSRERSESPLEPDLLPVVSAELLDLDGTGEASPGDEVVLRLRRPLPPRRLFRLEDLELAAPGDDWGVGASARFDPSGDRDAIRVRLGGDPEVRVYGTYRPGTAGRSVSQVRSTRGPVPILVRAVDRKAFVGDRFADSPDLRAYYGQMHAHTGFSDGDLEPADAFRMARERGLDFYAVTDHLEQLTDDEWERSRAAADLADAPGSFVALRGFEWGGFMSPRGWMNHVNVVGAEGRLSVLDTLSLRRLYDGILRLPGANVVGQFNHPGMLNQVFGRNNWNDFAYDDAGDLRMKLITVETVPTTDEDHRETAGYIPALDRGWHLAPKGEEDNHHADWAHTRKRTGVWAPALSRSDVLSAALRMAVFYTDDPEASVKLRADGQWLMGSTVYAPGAHRLEVEVEHHRRVALVTRVELVSRGGVVLATSPGGNTPFRASFDVNPETDTYYFARVVLEDPNVRLISAPIFVDR
jgi:hypothetical protein